MSLLAGTRKRSCRDDGNNETFASSSSTPKGRRSKVEVDNQSSYVENFSGSDSDMQDGDEEDIANRPTKEMLADWRFHVHGKCFSLFGGISLYSNVLLLSQK